MPMPNQSTCGTGFRATPFFKVIHLLLGGFRNTIEHVTKIPITCLITL